MDTSGKTTWFPRPPISRIFVPCPFYLTSGYACQPCKTRNDKERMKKVGPCIGRLTATVVSLQHLGPGAFWQPT
jgi:hypothetical protein